MGFTQLAGVEIKARLRDLHPGAIKSLSSKLARGKNRRALVILILLDVYYDVVPVSMVIKD